MIEELQKLVEAIDDNVLLNPKRVIEMGVVVNTKLIPSVFTFYRLIKRGQLKAVNLGSGGSPRYFVKGRDLKAFLTDRYQLNPVEDEVMVNDEGGTLKTN